MKFLNIILVSLTLVNIANCISVNKNKNIQNNYKYLADEKKKSQNDFTYPDIDNWLKRALSDLQDEPTPIAENHDGETKAVNENKIQEKENKRPSLQQSLHIPDKCNTSYDAIAIIDGEIIAFKIKYMFGPKMDITHIRSRWKSLSPKMTHVDAVYQTKNGKVLFFRGQVVYIFAGTRLEKKLRLSDLGIDPSALKIDAIFRRHDSQQTYIFINDYYYRFDEYKLKVTGYANRIQDAFGNATNMDTAFTDNDGITYFFKNEFYHEFIEKSWKLQIDRKDLSAERFMNCSELNIRINNGLFDLGKDYVNDESVNDKYEPNCNNPEMDLCKSHNPAVKRHFPIIYYV